MPTTLYANYLLEARYPSGRVERIDCGSSLARAQAERLYYERLGATVLVLGRGERQSAA